MADETVPAAYCAQARYENAVRQICVFVSQKLAIRLSSRWFNYRFIESMKHSKHTGGRPLLSKAQKQEYRITLRLDTEHKLRLQTLTRAAGWPRTEVLRQLIAAGQVCERLRREHLDFMSQLKGMARNLNQLTRLAHSKGLMGLVSRHMTIVAGIEALLKQLAMIGKIIAGSSFAGTVGYVMKKQSRILTAEGVTPLNVRDMVQDFKDQTLLNPRIKNAVGHISLSFSPKDTFLTDALMLDIAKEYMQRMGITDTQYLLVRHLDQPHPHCHLVYNRIRNNGQTISDKNMKIRNAKVSRALTEKYGLHLAPDKESVRREHLREPDKTKYEIYDAIKMNLPNCGNWNDLELRLKKQGIAMRYKYCGDTDRNKEYYSVRMASSSPARRSTDNSATRN